MMFQEDGRTALLQGGDSGSFDEYAAEFTRLRGLAWAEVESLKAQPSSERAKAAQKAFADVESNWRQIQVQLRLGLSGLSRDSKSLVSGWGDEVQNLRSQLDAELAAQNRRSLFSSSSGSAPAERGSALSEAKRVALDTEEVGQGVLNDLAAQRETILNVRGNVRTIDTELTQARRSLDRMIAVAQRNRLATLVIAGVFSLGISFWILCVLGLSLKSTFLLAIAMVILLLFLLTLRRRMQTGRWELPFQRFA
eukprot:symbB.v1.2.003319.t1/scaffold187.1/size278738/4